MDFDLQNPNFAEETETAKPAASNLTPIRELPADAVDVVRAASGQRLVSSVRMVNEQVRGADADARGVQPSDAIDFVRSNRVQSNVADVRNVNEQVRGANAGDKTAYSIDATQMSTEMSAQDTTHNYRRVNEQARGEFAGMKTAVTAEAWHIAEATRSQNEVADYARINEQIAPVLPGTIPAEAVDIVRSDRVQSNVADVRIINEQIRGANAGERTLVGSDSAQISTEISAQRTTHTYLRVNEQARGELVGKQTAYDFQARELQRTLDQAKSIAASQRVNEQISGADAGTIPADAVDFVRSNRVQSNVADVRNVNEQVRGANAGDKTAYSIDATQMSTEMSAQDTTHNYRRVNEQARGEFVGCKTNIDAGARSIVAAAQVPKPDLVNNQVKEVGSGTIDMRSVSMVHAKERLAQNTYSQESKKLTARSSFGGDSLEMQRLQAVPRLQQRNEQVRGELAGVKTGITAATISIAHSLNAPKRETASGQFTGVVTKSGNADASASTKMNEWRPESEIIMTPVADPEDTPVTPQKQVPTEPCEVCNPQTSNLYSMFGLRKTVQTCTCNATNKAASPPPSSPIVDMFNRALSMFR